MRLRKFVIHGIVVGLLAAGCGGSDNGGSETDTDPAAIADDDPIGGLALTAEAQGADETQVAALSDSEVSFRSTKPLSNDLSVACGAQDSPSGSWESMRVVGFRY